MYLHFYSQTAPSQESSSSASGSSAPPRKFAPNLSAARSVVSKMCIEVLFSLGKHAYAIFNHWNTDHAHMCTLKSADLCFRQSKKCIRVLSPVKICMCKRTVTIPYLKSADTKHPCNYAKYNCACMCALSPSLSSYKYLRTNHIFLLSSSDVTSWLHFHSLPSQVWTKPSSGASCGK